MAFMTKEEIRRRQRETMKIVKILDDVDWVYGPKARVKRHERSEWAQKALSGGTLQASGARPPKWIASRIEALPSGATLCFNLCERQVENVAAVTSAEKEAIFKRICEEFGILKESKKQKLDGQKSFPALVRHYIRTKFKGVQIRAAHAAHLDPQVVNQIYKAFLARNGKKCRGGSKRTVIALGLAFELTFDEMVEFLRSAGYSFLDSDEDKLFELCFRRRFYEISKINELLLTIPAQELGSRSWRE